MSMGNRHHHSQAEFANICSICSEFMFQHVQISIIYNDVRKAIAIYGMYIDHNCN